MIWPVVSIVTLLLSVVRFEANQNYWNLVTDTHATKLCHALRSTSGTLHPGHWLHFRNAARQNSPRASSCRRWHLNRIHRSTRCGRDTAGRFRTGTTSRSGAGWRKRSASSKAGRGGSRIRSSARTGWRRSSRTTGRSGSSGWPRRRRLMRNRRAAAPRFCRCSRVMCASRV